MRVLLTLVAALLALPVGAASADGGPIMPLSQVQPGMDCTGETVIQGTTISSFNVHVINIVQDPQFGPRILVTVSGPAVSASGIAEGFSGSPVYCPTGFGGVANAGALSAGLPEYGNDLGEVTPIEQMLGEAVTPPASAARLTVRAKPLAGPLTISGLSPTLLHLVEKAGAHAGRLITGQPAGTTTSFPVQPLVPGASVGVSYSSGAIVVGAVGTVTYTNGSSIYAFGHELDGAGRRSLLLQDAYVYDVVSNPVAGSFKFAAPGHTEGVLTSDTPNAVIGQVGNPPQLVPVHVSAHDLDTGQSIALDSEVADETDIGLPLGSSAVDGIAPLEVAQAATQIYNGPPSNESGRMCVGIYIRESRGPLGFCNRYVGTGAPGDSGPSPPELANATLNDMMTAFGFIEQVQFQALHVTKVVAHIYAQRGLAEATLLSANAPFVVHHGQRVTVRLTVRMIRGALKTLSFRMRIPSKVRGLYNATLSGPAQTNPPGPPGGLFGPLNDLLASLGLTPGPPPSGPPNAPTSIGDLRQDIAGIGVYDGLRLISPGRPTRPVYRDPSLVLAGRADLAFNVK